MATIKHARTLALQATSPRINPVPLPGNVTVNTGNLTDGAVSGPKIGVGAVGTGNLTDGAVSGPKIGVGAVGTGNLTDGAVTAAKITDATITTAKIADGSITNAKIGTLAVDTANIASAAITSAKIGTAAIGTAAIADAAITNAKIGALAVDAAKIAAATITTAKIANAAITTALIADANITNAKIGAAAVDTAKIADAAITNAKIGALAVDAAKIADATITTAKIADAQITSAKIASATITDANIASLSASKINAGTISANYINGGTFSGASIQIASTVGWLFSAGLNGITLTYRRMSGYNIYAGNLDYPGDSPLIGSSGSSAAGVYGTSSNAGGHGVRGEAGSGLGFVGYNGGSYDFYAAGSASNYGPFTGAHDALVLKSAALEAGDIVRDVQVLVRRNLSNTLCEVALCDAPNQAAVGVVCQMPKALDMVHTLPAAMIEHRIRRPGEGNLSEGETIVQCPEWYDLRLTHDAITINALGEGQINVCGAGGNLQPGDLITTSALPGKGQRQADDVVRASSVAKCREAVTFDFPEQVRLVACIYLCG